MTEPAASEAGPFLGRLIGALDQAGVPHMLAGSFASSVHGAPRTTRDIDLVIAPTLESLERLLTLLAGEDFYFDVSVAREEFARRGQFNVIDSATAWKAMLRPAPVVSQAVANFRSSFRPGLCVPDGAPVRPR